MLWLASGKRRRADAGLIDRPRQLRAHAANQAAGRLGDLARGIFAHPAHLGALAGQANLIVNDHQPDEFRVRAPKREGRCYELALRGILEPGAAGFMLVHGTVTGPDNTRVDHAWLLDPVRSRIYEPVKDRWFDEAGFKRFYAAVAERQYTVREAADAVLAANHSGPWQK